MTDTTQTMDASVGKSSRWGRELKKMRSNKMLMIGGVIVLIFIIMVIVGPEATGYDHSKMSIRERFQGPSPAHWMGTDNFGRDTFARIIHGARVSFLVGVLSVSIGLVAGMLIGAIAGFTGGFLDNLLMRITDALLAFPPLLLAVGLVAAIGPSIETVSVIIGIIYIPRFARIMRGAVLSEKSKEYVEAARAIGQEGEEILRCEEIRREGVPVLEGHVLTCDRQDMSGFSDDLAVVHDVAADQGDVSIGEDEPVVLDRARERKQQGLRRHEVFVGDAGADGDEVSDVHDGGLADEDAKRIGERNGAVRHHVAIQVARVLGTDVVEDDRVGIGQVERQGVVFGLLKIFPADGRTARADIESGQAGLAVVECDGRVVEGGVVGVDQLLTGRNR